MVTSAFHMPRAESIFRHVFDIGSEGKFTLAFHATPNEGLVDTPALKLREEKEATSLETWETNKERFRTLADLSVFLFTEHNAYSARGRLASLDVSETDAAAASTPQKPSASTASATTTGTKNLLDTY